MRDPCGTHLVPVLRVAPLAPIIAVDGVAAISRVARVNQEMPASRVAPTPMVVMELAILRAPSVAGRCVTLPARCAAAAMRAADAVRERRSPTDTFWGE